MLSISINKSILQKLLLIYLCKRIRFLKFIIINVKTHAYIITLYISYIKIYKFTFELRS